MRWFDFIGEIISEKIAQPIQGQVFVRIPLLSTSSCHRKYQELRIKAWYIMFFNEYVENIIVPGSRWNILPPGTLTLLTLMERQGLNPPLK